MKVCDVEGDSGRPKSVQLGVLLANLGTPDEPTATAVRRYLKEFLSDRRVVEVPRLRWWFILHGIILNLRPRKSAALYRKIWRADGSPLLKYTCAQARQVQAECARRFAEQVAVVVGMRYGNPSLEAALDELETAGAEHILVLPLYPQYSAATTGSTFDAVTRVLSGRRRVPALRFVNQFYRDARYIEALKASVLEHWAVQGRGEHLLISFHGLPKSSVSKGDPYFVQCLESGKLLAQALELDQSQYTVTFQSRFGGEEWLQPYTDQTVRSLPKRGIKAVDVICPGFVTDCLETLEEIEEENKRYFWEAGGERFSYIPALNDRADFGVCLSEIVAANIHGWVGEVRSDGGKAGDR